MGPQNVMTEFDEIFIANSARLVQLAYLLTGSRVIAEDLTQDAFERLSRSWGTVHDPPAWLRTVLVNLCRSHGRRVTLERLRPPRREELVGDVEIDDTWSRIRKLPSRQRTALVLRYWEDLSLADTATAMDLTATAVSSLVHRALATLRKELE